MSLIVSSDKLIAIGWHPNAPYPPSYTGFANVATVALIVVGLVETVVFFRRKWKNRKKR